MKRNFRKRIIALVILSTTLLASTSIGVYATDISTTSVKTSQWIQVNGEWQYNDALGNSMKNTWFHDESGGKWYYFNSDGIMSKNTTINGKYLVGNDGAWVESGTINNTRTSNVQTTNTYSAGQTWVVDGQWEFTINSVTITGERNQFDNSSPAQVVYIDYSYKNLGYTGKTQDLYISSLDYKVVDEKGEVATLYPDSVEGHSPQVVSVGEKCSNAMIAYGLKNNSSKITIHLEQYRSDSYKQEKATYIVPVDLNQITNATVNDSNNANIINSKDNSANKNYDSNDASIKSTTSTTSDDDDDYYDYSSKGSNETWVSGYYRKGKYVSGHYRTKKDSTTSNNYSHKGNTNPHNGKKGYSKK